MTAVLNHRFNWKRKGARGSCLHCNMVTPNLNWISSPLQGRGETSGIGKIRFISYFDNGVEGSTDMCGDMSSSCDFYFDPIEIIGAK